MVAKMTPDRIDTASILNFLDAGTFLLAEREHLLQGCVYVERREQGRAYLGLLAVDPATQQSGLGSLLMRGAEDYCRGLGLGFIDIKIVNLRTELTGFYGRRGYIETGTFLSSREHNVSRVLRGLVLRHGKSQRRQVNTG